MAIRKGDPVWVRGTAIKTCEKQGEVTVKIDSECNSAQPKIFSCDEDDVVGGHDAGGTGLQSDDTGRPYLMDRLGLAKQ